MEDGGHDGDVERAAVHGPVGVGEELLAERVRLGVLADLDVVGEDLLELGLGEVHLLRELGTRLEALHEAATAVVLFVRRREQSEGLESKTQGRTLQCHSISLLAWPLRMRRTGYLPLSQMRLFASRQSLTL